MNDTSTAIRRAACLLAMTLLPLVLLGAAVVFLPQPALAQQPGPQPDEPAPPDGFDDAIAEAEAALAAEEPVVEGQSEPSEGEEGEAAEVAEKINILELLVRGGHLMWPIAFMSLLVVTFGGERLLGLRRRKILPPELVSGLGNLAGQQGGLDPRKAYKLCQQYPSAAASVIKTMLLKVGRPHTEVEHAVSEANDREAARLYSNVRWLALAAGITPLMGLLGTVWGMIQAFFATANLPTGANKAEHLAQGIYVALVTTFAGLSVAIPAAVLAHLFEGRIQKLFRELDETLLGLMPQLERFEGRMRVSRDSIERPAAAPATQQPAATPK